MALNTELSNAAANAATDAIATLANTGYLRIYDGSKPASANTPVSSQILLAELRFGSTAFAAAVAGVATANAITSDTDANASGTASWFRVLKSDGTALWDGTVGTSGCNINLNSTSIAIHAQVDVTALTFTISESNAA